MIVVFGDAIVDLFAVPRGSDVATATQFVPFAGGAPANVATVIGRLGARCRFVGALGADAHGDRLIAALAAAGVDTHCVARVPQRTSVTFVRVGTDGARSFLFYRHGGADLALSPEHLGAFAVAPLNGARWLYLTSSALLAAPLADSASVLLATAGEMGVSVFVDLNVRPHLWPDREQIVERVRALAARAAVVKASEEDLSALGLPPTPQGLQEILAPGAVALLTLAERGAVMSLNGHTIATAAPVVDVVDATGAGDAFAATVLAALAMRGVDGTSARLHSRDLWAPVLSMACAVGARAVTAMGATEGVRELGDIRAELMRG